MASGSREMEPWCCGQADPCPMAQAGTADKLPPVAPTPSSPPLVSLVQGTQDAQDAIIGQPQKGFFRFPSELRLAVYEYMTLSPVSSDCLSWTGAYFASRRMQAEMRDALNPERGLEHFKHSLGACNISRYSFPHHYHVPVESVEPLFPQSSFGLLQHVTVRMDIPERRSIHDFLHYDVCNPDGLIVLGKLYVLRLNRLHIVVYGQPAKPARRDAYCYGDLKSLDDRLFINFANRQQVNCKAVTFSLEHLADAEHGHYKSTALDIALPSGVPYTFTIVQDKEKKQTEKTYFSATRFKQPKR